MQYSFNECQTGLEKILKAWAKAVRFFTIPYDVCFLPTLFWKRLRTWQTVTYIANIIFSCQTTLKKLNFRNFDIKNVNLATMLDKVASRWCRAAQVRLLLVQSALWKGRNYAASEEIPAWNVCCLVYMKRLQGGYAFLSVAISFSYVRFFFAFHFTVLGVIRMKHWQVLWAVFALR